MLAIGRIHGRCASRLVLRASRISACTGAVAVRRASFVPRAVKQVYIEDVTSASFTTDFLQAEAPQPLHLVRRNPIEDRVSIIDRLLQDPASQSCVVDLEIGRYDREDMEKVQLPLAFYLEWLKDGKERGMMNGKQVYLAQWRGLDDVPSVQQYLCPPEFLKSSFDSNRADLYQTSFFVGGSGAMTPLHYDPYINLFRLHTSSPTASKHFLMLPPTPTMTSYMKRPSDESVMKNTSPVDFLLDGDVSLGQVDGISITQGSPSQSYIDVIAKEALAVSLRDGEMLLLPEKWWHRVQNIGDEEGWTAGVAYWFRTRSIASK